MNKKIVLAMMFVAAASVFTFAQEEGVKFGVRAGLNLGSMTYIRDSKETEISSGNTYSRKSDIDQAYGNSIGFHVGAIADVKILDFLYVQPGLMFSKKGAEDNTERKETGSSYNRSEKNTVTIAPYYIDIPVMLSLKGSLASDLSLRANVGPYFGIGLFGEQTTEYKDSEYPDDGEKFTRNLFSETTIEGHKFDAILNRFNFGVGFGVGIEYSSFYFGVNYNYGLTNMSKEREEEGYKYEENGGLFERTLGITLGYNF